MVPTKTTFEVSEVYRDRIAGGRIVGHRRLVDEMGMMEQFGATPSGTNTDPPRASALDRHDFVEGVR